METNKEHRQVTRMNDETVERLHAIAKATHRNCSEAIRHMIDAEYRRLRKARQC